MSQDQADLTRSRLMPSMVTLGLYLLAGTAIGLLALLSGIPAAPLAGALLGAGIVSMSGQLEAATWPPGTRTVLQIGIGTVIGTGLTRTSLEQLQVLWKPAVLITLALVLTGLVVGLWSMLHSPTTSPVSTSARVIRTAGFHKTCNCSKEVRVRPVPITVPMPI